MRDPRKYDRWAQMGRAEGRAAQEQLSDTVAVFRLLFRLITLPLWLPVKLWLRYRRKRRERTDSAQDDRGF